MTRPEAALIDELEFRSYVHNRKMFPEVELGRWAAIFSNVPEMEERYLDMLSTGNILDFSAASSGERSPLFQQISAGSHTRVDGVSRQCELSPNRGERGKVPDAVNESGRVALIVLDVADRATGNAPVTDGLQVGDEGGGEILSSSPLYLSASEIVDIVEFSEQLRLEEEAAAEEGAAIEASNMPYPEYERNGR